MGWYSIRKGDNKPLQVNKGGICGVLGVVVSVPAGWVFLLLCPCLLLGVLAGWVSVVFVAGAGCCPCCVYWLAGRWVKGKGERQYKINIPTQNIIYPPLEGGI